MTNEEYQQLVYDIAYQTILEEFGEEYLLEKKSEIEKTAGGYHLEYINGGLWV